MLPLPKPLQNARKNLLVPFDSNARPPAPHPGDGPLLPEVVGRLSPPASVPRPSSSLPLLVSSAYWRVQSQPSAARCAGRRDP